MSEPAPRVEARRFTVLGRDVAFPVVVRDASSLAATFLVSARAAAGLLPHPDLEIAEALPGSGLLSIACIEYRDNDLGDYDEVSLALFVRRRGERAVPYVGTVLDLVRSRLATWIWKLPVTQEFTRAAGSEIWGFPKTVERITFADGAGERHCRLEMDGRHVLTLVGPRGGTRTIPDAAMLTYTTIGGALHATRFVAGAHAAGFAMGRGRLDLGDHAVAERLRALGLPRRPVLTVWMGRQHGRFEAPERVEP